MFQFFGGKKKAVIGMVHIGALPGTPLYDEKGGMKALIEGLSWVTTALMAATEAVGAFSEYGRSFSLPNITASMPPLCSASRSAAAP